MSNKINVTEIREMSRSIIFSLRKNYRSEEYEFHSDKELAAYLGITPAQFSRVSSCVCTPSAPLFANLLFLYTSNGGDLVAFMYGYYE